MLGYRGFTLSSIDGTEYVEVDNGGPQPTRCTTAQIAALAAVGIDGTTITAINTVGAGTLTAAGILGGVITRGGAQSATAFSDATATAAAIIALMSGGEAPVGADFELLIENTTDGQETITAGVGVTLSGNVIIPKLTTARYLVTKTSATAVLIVFLSGGTLSPLPVSVTDTQAITTAITLQLGGLTGGQTSSLILTSATAVALNLALPPASELIAAIPNVRVGLSYVANIRNAYTTTSIATITGSATGVTLSGTATIAQNATGMFNILITSLTTYTATRIGP